MQDIALIGDIALHGIISSDAIKNEQRFFHISNVLQKYQFVLANLELPVEGKERNENKKNHYFTNPDSTRSVLKMLNIGCVSLANNHIFDCKMSGLKATINILDECGIFHTGAGWLPNHIDPVVFALEGKSFGFIAYVDRKTNPKTENFSELFINYFEIEKVKNDILKLKSKVDKVICSIHWGEDYSNFPLQQQIQIAHTLVDSGAFILMGHHPHTLQPFEIYKTGTIFYSLGGLVFGDFMKQGKLNSLYRKTKNSVVVTFDGNENTIKYFLTKELKGNYINITNKSFEKWSNKIWLFFRVKESSLFTKWLFDFYEKFLYRFYEYFFGYYHNPLKRIVQLSNLKKIKKLFFSTFNK